MNTEKEQEYLDRIAELEKEIKRTHHKIKKDTYGLHWLDVPEAFEDDVEKKLPILKEVKEKAIINDDGKPTHILIEGDNYHALTCLNYTHKGKIDVIYIDPPYNTGKDGFKYKDKRFLTQYPDGTEVPIDHPLRHSYWLSFMKKRLELSKTLLNDNGVIFISIDDNEIAQLKLLCEQVFGSKNFIATLIWQQGKKHIGTFIGVNHEYMLVFAKNRDFINDNNKWRQRKEGLEQIYNELNKLQERYKNNYPVIRVNMKSFYDSLKENNPAKSQKHYCWVDKRGLYFPDNISQGTGNGPKYDVIHPLTKKPCLIPEGGWRYKIETMAKLLKEDRIHFGKNEQKVPCRKRYLKETEFELPTSVFYKDGRAATGFVSKLLGAKKFENPKDTKVLKRIINFKENTVILDFFAGSGSTAQAVMELNEEDQGNRQWILVTNNESKIMSNVCYPRIKKIMSGAKITQNISYPGLGNSIKYFTTDFIGEHNILGANDSDKTELAHHAGEMLAIAENTLYEMEDYQTNFYQFFQNEKHYTAVYFREELEQFEKFRDIVLALENPVSVYVFSWGENEFADQFDDRDDIEVKPIPQPILEVYKTIFNLSD